MANRLRQTVQSIEGTPAEELGLKPGVVSDPVGAARVAAEMLPGSGFVTGVQKGGTEGGIDFLAELLGIAGGIGGAVAGPPGIAGGYMLGKGGVKGLRSLLKKEVSENLPKDKKGLKSVEVGEDLFEDILKTPEGDPVVLYRGVMPSENKELTESMLQGKSREGYATFLSDNPSVAESYAGKEGAVTPFIVKPKKIIEYEDKYTRQNAIKPGSTIDFDKFEFDKQARNLKEGEVLVVKNVRDTGPRVIQSGPNDPKYWSYGSDVYAVKDENVLLSAISPSTKISKEIALAKPLDVGVDENLISGKALKNYNENDFNILDDLVSQGKATAGTKKANQLLDAPIETGTNVGVRLNLNSKIEGTPENLKPMLQTLHKNSASGKALSYKPYATVVATDNKKVKFYVSPKGREDIATGNKAKYPAMSVNGAYDPNLKILPSDPNVIEIGFNPKAHHLFIDLKTGQAVKEADAATIIGDRVYAKGVTYFKKSEAPKPKAASQVRYKEKKKGGSVVESNPYNYQLKAI